MATEIKTTSEGTAVELARAGDPMSASERLLADIRGAAKARIAAGTLIVPRQTPDQDDRRHSH